ncbi:MAG: FKBP-type peptidyl-prolyl cis-trans isomerase [Tunicatimonas sp.]
MRHCIQNLVWIVLLSITLGGCLSDDADVADPNQALFEEQQQTIEQFLQDQDIATQQTATGIHYRVITENADGIDPSPGNVAKLYYHIEQLDGTLIAEQDSSMGDPVTYTFAYSSPNPNRFHLTLPVGLDGMVGLMREGEVYEFFLPSGAAYLDYELPNVIPTNAIVRARILLDRVLTVAQQQAVEDQKIKDYLATESLTGFDSLTSGVYYATTQVGDTSVQVAPTSAVGVRYTGSLLNGTVFDTNTGADDNLYEFSETVRRPIEGFLVGVQQMSLGEKGTILIPSHAAYGEGVFAIPQSFVKDLKLLEERDRFNTIPPYAILRFDVEVVEIK